MVLPKRHRQVARAEQRSGKTLSEEEKAKIEPISEASEFLSFTFSCACSGIFGSFFFV
ncbi:leader peptidase (signal peptidase I) [Haemophilus influenzae]|uniref:Leader peptidase (Signal peptidase I) n=1 Tax=Haemophilus influenzae TaxID=727 RepID=A0A2X1RMN9_HAEIF|nr:leader peptidase (signal peptidase I) [Haemophilus influenzae]